MQSPSGRIRRGFSRAGVAFATLFALIAAAVGLYNGVSEWRTISDDYAQAQCILRYNLLPDAPWVTGLPVEPPAYARDIGCPGSLIFIRADQAGHIVSEGIEGKHRKFVTDAAIVAATMAVIAAGIWFVFFSLGWVISGFARD